jgi:hypothetical protein
MALNLAPLSDIVPASTRAAPESGIAAGAADVKSFPIIVSAWNGRMIASVLKVKKEISV